MMRKAKKQEERTRGGYDGIRKRKEHQEMEEHSRKGRRDIEYRESEVRMGEYDYEEEWK